MKYHVLVLVLDVQEHQKAVPMRQDVMDVQEVVYPLVRVHVMGLWVQ